MGWIHGGKAKKFLIFLKHFHFLFSKGTPTCHVRDVPDDGDEADNPDENDDNHHS